MTLCNNVTNFNPDPPIHYKIYINGVWHIFLLHLLQILLL